MQYEHLISLFNTYATHEGRSAQTVSRRAGLHLAFFPRLVQGYGCRVDTFNKAMGWFAENWPSDLDWPADVPRPSAPKKQRRAA